MPLLKFKDLYSDDRQISSDTDFDMDELKGFSVYAQGDDKVGSVDDVLVDSNDGNFRYFIVDTGFWVFGKKVLLPVGRASLDYDDKRIYVNGLTKEQVENLPSFDDLEKVDFDYEEQVRGVYRPVDASASMSTAAPVTPAATYDHDSYSYDRDPDLYNLNDRDHQSLKLYQERLVANKYRQKTGEVSIGKRVETQTAQVSVPIQKERVVVERTTLTEEIVVDPSEVTFGSNEVARMEVYEETPEVRKEAFVREEVQVKKVVDHDLVKADEQVRREELDVDTQGRPVVDKQV